jgi:putative ABC transport system permease protein
MWRNYLSAAIRSLFRDRAYAAINICGLAVGLSALLLIALYVRDEFSYDHIFPDYAQTYRIATEFTQPGRAPIRMPSTTSSTAAAMELAFPEVEFATRLKTGLGTLRHGDNEVFPEYLHWADPDFFRMFPVKVLAGDVSAALARPDGLVLSRRMARQLFDREDVVGQTVQLNRQQTLTVAAVIEDLPWNTHLRIDAVGSGKATFSVLAQLDALAATGAAQPDNTYTYVRLRTGASVDRINAGMGKFLTLHYPNKAISDAAGISVHYRLVRLPDLHFLPPSVALDMKPPSDRRIVRVTILVAVLILVVSVGNFVSMMTARAARRAVEVGVRKAVGATRRQIMVQFLAESLFYAGLAMALALLVVWQLLPGFNASAMAKPA